MVPNNKMYQLAVAYSYSRGMSFLGAFGWYVCVERLRFWAYVTPVFTAQRDLCG